MNYPAHDQMFLLQQVRRLGNGFIVAQHYGGRNQNADEFAQRHRHISSWKCRARKDVPDLPGFSLRAKHPKNNRFQDIQQSP
jgi:hypothetical protein